MGLAEDIRLRTGALLQASHPGRHNLAEAGMVSLGKSHSIPCGTTEPTAIESPPPYPALDTITVANHIPKLPADWMRQADRNVPYQYALSPSKDSDRPEIPTAFASM